MNDALYPLQVKNPLAGLISTFTFFASQEDKNLAKEILGTSKLSHKFQITIPKEVRDRFRLRAGEIIIFVDENDKLVLSKNVQS